MSTLDGYAARLRKLQTRWNPRGLLITEAQGQAALARLWRVVLMPTEKQAGRGRAGRVEQRHCRATDLGAVAPSAAFSQELGELLGKAAQVHARLGDSP